MTRTRFKVEINYELKNGFWDTADCMCELEPEERTPEECYACIRRKLAVPALYAEEKVLDSNYLRRMKITQLEDLYCQQILKDGNICNNRKVLRTCLICKKPFCEDHLDEEGVCESEACQKEKKIQKKKAEEKTKKRKKSHRTEIEDEVFLFHR